MSTSTPEDDPFGWVGATVDGKYRVDKVVGHGGFGIVYQAHHLGFEEKVALKCLKLPKELQGGDRDRFKDSLVAEGRLLLQLSRANLLIQGPMVGAPSRAHIPRDRQRHRLERPGAQRRLHHDDGENTD